MQTSPSFHSPAPQKAKSDPDASQTLPSELTQPSAAFVSIEGDLERVTRIARLLSDSLDPLDSGSPCATSWPQMPKLVSLYSAAFDLIQRSLQEDRRGDGPLLQVRAVPQNMYDTLAASLRAPEDPCSGISADEATEHLSPAPFDARQFRNALLFTFRVLDRLGHSTGDQSSASTKLRHCAEVGLSLLAAGLPADVVVAGILHDVLEAAAPVAPCYSLSESRAALRTSLSMAIAQRFGTRVENLVSAATEPHRTPDMFDFLYRKSAIWQRLQPGQERAGFIRELATLVCASKTNTLADGLAFLSRNQTTRGWSSGSVSENLFLCEALRKRFVDAEVSPLLLNQFDDVVTSWRQFNEQSKAHVVAPGEPPAARDFDAEALLHAKQITIVTGGQTGVDRAALDAALQLGYPIKGYCPAGRTAEDGVIDERYPLQAAPSPDNAWRTIANAYNSDVTVILSRGTPTDGTPLTSFSCEFYRRPYIEVSLDGPVDREALVSFIEKHQAKSINLAGPRESLDPGNVYAPALRVFLDLLTPRFEE